MGTVNWILQLDFKTQETGITCGTTKAVLTGKNLVGQLFSGGGDIHTVSCPSRTRTR